MKDPPAPIARSRASVTALLFAWRQGDQQALDQLTQIVYQELRRLAQHHIRRERPGQTLDATSLVHEAYLRLVDIDVDWQDRAHFLAVAARLMRRILINRCRDKARLKRGGGEPVFSLGDIGEPPGDPATSGSVTDLLALDLALRELADLDAVKARVIELVYFGGLTYPDVAEALGISRATVHRHLKMGRAWLHHRLTSR